MDIPLVLKVLCGEDKCGVVVQLQKDGTKAPHLKPNHAVCTGGDRSTKCFTEALWKYANWDVALAKVDCPRCNNKSKDKVVYADDNGLLLEHMVDRYQVSEDLVWCVEPIRNRSRGI